MTRENEWSRTAARAALVLVLLAVSCARTIQLPSYDDFVSLRQRAIPSTVMEVYGRFTASHEGKSVKASFNLLLEPGQKAYLEILNPSQQLTYAFALNRNELTLLWAKEGDYIREEATPQNLQAIAGFPVQPDDLMLLIGGYGLNFAEWGHRKVNKDGWSLERPPFFTARLVMKEQISRIAVASSSSPEVRVEYGDYRMTNNRLVPHDIRMEVAGRKISMQLKIDKFLPRDEPADETLFDVELPEGARRLMLKEIYKGKPLIIGARASSPPDVGVKMGS